MLSLYDFDKLFDDEMNKTIDDKLLIHIEDVKLNTKSDNNYLNMEIGLPWGEYVDLHFTVLDRSKLENEVQKMGKDKNNHILYTKFYEI